MYLQEINHTYTTADGLLAGEVADIRLHEGRVYAFTRLGACRFDDGRWRRATHVPALPPVARPEPPAELPFRDVVVQCAARDGAGTLWIGTDRGVMLYNAGAWREVTGEDGLPLRDVRVIALGADGSAWFGGPRGAARLLDGRWCYYGGLRWLPDDRVNAIALAPDGDVWIATQRGVGRIERRAMTLAEKAAHFEQSTVERHRRHGFVARSVLRKPGDLSTGTLAATDNDGLWTSLYVAAECFRAAATGDPEARALARESMQALLLLLDVTGCPGFPARAIVQKGERVSGYDLDSPVWQPAVPEYADTFWKGDTSSDEIDGHYLAWYLYHTLVADEEEKRRIEEACRAVTNNILDHGYRLVGPDGKPTHWGNWSPETLNEDPTWLEERGLNALEILSHLRVAMHLCGDERFREAYRDLIENHHYALNTIDQKVLPPRGTDNHSDDQLAWCAYYPLLMLEDDPDLRRLYRWSLERTQQILRPQGSPLYDYLYAAITGRRLDAQECLEWLRESPWDLVRWTALNSHRPDVRISGERGRFGELQAQRVLPVAERTPTRWNTNPFELDAGSDGLAEMDGAFWLLPYWLGRYHGLLEAD